MDAMGIFAPVLSFRCPRDSPRVLASPGAHDFPVHMMAGLQESGWNLGKKKRWAICWTFKPWTPFNWGGVFFSNIF